jgi:V/A-type H+-transporting ATPase subunit K
MNSALILAYVGVALMVGLAGIASSVGTAICGQTAVGAMKKNGAAFGSYMILSALPGSQGLYGFVCFFMVTNLYPLVGPAITPAQGAAVLGIGLLVGMVNLLAAVYQGKVCASGIAAIGNGHDVMGKTLILAAFPELYAILTVAATYLIASVAISWGAPAEVAEVVAEAAAEVVEAAPAL